MFDNMIPFRSSETPTNALILLNGKNLNNWTMRDKKPAKWRVADGFVEVVPGAGDIATKEHFTDFYLYLEFRCPDMREATGQAKGNSGVFLQGRYEIQVLDSYEVNIPGKGDCGAIYNQFAPLVNACKPPLEWQTYEVIFRSARRGNERLLEPARVTVLQNGTVIHNNIELQGPTGDALDEREGEPGPLLLQDHGDLVSYRNIWAVHLSLTGSNQYESR